MNVDGIEERILNIVQDQSYEGETLKYINNALGFIAGKFKLASLEVSDTVICVSTDDHVALPSNYMHSVYFVSKPDGTQVGTPEQFYDFSHYLRKNPSRKSIGRINAIAVKGNSLYYAAREDISLDVRYFEKPAMLTNSTDTPLFIPEHLHEPLVVNYAASQIFNLIEDGIEDPKTNTKAYYSMFSSFLGDLGMYSVDTNQPLYVLDECGL